jgi:hypothetical protein
VSFEPGVRVGDRYRIERTLARGGMGEVFVAFDERLEERVALKVTAAAGEGAAAVRARFKREAVLANRLGRVPGVVRARDWGELGDGVRLFLVLDLVEGAAPLDPVAGPLAARLARLERVAEVLATVHRAGVVHRDVKPGNLLVDAGGAVHVTDLGLAKEVGSEDDVAGGVTVDGVTLTGTAIGTPAYMPPEQFDDAGRVDARADVYALGVLLHLTLAGRVPYPGRVAEILAAQARVRRGEAPPPRPRLVDPSVPDGLDRLAAEATALDPLSRPADAGAFLARLRAAREEAVAGVTGEVLGPGAAPPATAQRLSEGGTPTGALQRPTEGGVPTGALAPAPSRALPTGAEVPTDTPRRPARRARLGPAAAALALLAAVGAGAAAVGAARRPAEVHLARRPTPAPATDAPAAAPPRLEVPARLVVATPRFRLAGRVVPAVGGLDVATAVGKARVAADGAFEVEAEAPAPVGSSGVVRVLLEGPAVEPVVADVEVVVDAGPPTVEVVAPAAGHETWDDDVEVVVRVSDDAPVEVRVAEVMQVKLDGSSTQVHWQQSAPVRLDPAPRAVEVRSRVPLSADGPRRLEVVATDALGRTTTARVVVVRTTPPLAFELTSPADGAWVGSWVRVTGRVVPAVGDLVVRGQGGASAAPGPDGRFTLDLPQAAPGPRALELLAVGLVGSRPVEKRRAVPVTVDLDPPRLTLGGVPDPRAVLGPLDLEVRAQDDGPAVTLTLAVEGPDGPRPGDVVHAGQVDALERAWRVRVVPPAGRSRVVVRAADAAGNRAVEELELVRVTPAWLDELPQELRPPLPLPDGVRFGDPPGEYVLERDGSRLVLVPPEQDFAGRRPLLAGRFEVTNAQWDAFLAAHGRPPRRRPPDLPAVDLDHGEAEAYAAWAGGRLPSTVEWLHLASWHARDDRTVRKAANFKGEEDGHAGVAPVGSCAADRSRWGARDVFGNVREWVNEQRLPGEPSFHSSTCGGSWRTERTNQWPHGDEVNMPRDDLGLRLVVSLPAPRER